MGKKKKKVNEEEEEEVDKISDLPDAILHHIFSFLNMEEAVRSSVYSKRWRDLWTSLPTLNFEYKDNYDDDDDAVERIADLVDKVFNLRDGSSNITRFSLICPYLPNTSPVGTWVTSALSCNVQEMAIEIDDDWFWRHPIANFSTLFNSKSLTFLRLVCSAEDNRLNLKLPHSVRLPSLKTLFLQNISFGDYTSDDINRLVSSCPVLESLTIAYSWFNEYVKISSLSLKHLVFVDNDDCCDYDYDYGGVFKLITPNLISFKCTDYLSNTYYVEDMSSLIKAYINIKPPEARRMLKFLRAFRNVRDLTLSASVLKVISGSPDLLEAEPIELCVLSIFRLKTFLSRDTIPAITYLLNISPEVKSLFVEISRIGSGSSDIGDYPEAETSSQCLLDNLELVEIRDAVGCVNELYFIKLLLKNAKVLKKMVVYTSKKDSPEREERMLKFNEKLLTFPKASSDITILFI